MVIIECALNYICLIYTTVVTDFVVIFGDSSHRFNSSSPEKVGAYLINIFNMVSVGWKWIYMLV